MAEFETVSRKYSGLFRVRETCGGGAVALENKQDVCRGARGGLKCPVPDSVGLLSLHTRTLPVTVKSTNMATLFL